MSKIYQKGYRDNMNKNKKREKLISDIGII